MGVVDYPQSKMKAETMQSSQLCRDLPCFTLLCRILLVIKFGIPPSLAFIFFSILAVLMHMARMWEEYSQGFIFAGASRMAGWDDG